MFDQFEKALLEEIIETYDENDLGLNFGSIVRSCHVNGLRGMDKLKFVNTMYKALDKLIQEGMISYFPVYWNTPEQSGCCCSSCMAVKDYIYFPTYEGVKYIEGNQNAST